MESVRADDGEHSEDVPTEHFQVEMFSMMVTNVTGKNAVDRVQADVSARMNWLHSAVRGQNIQVDDPLILKR